MPDGVFLVNRSHRLSKVNAFNSTAAVFAFQQIPREMPPGGTSDPLGLNQGPSESDVKRWGAGGMDSPRLVFLQPYVEAPEGTSFYLNVWGFTEAGFENTRQAIVWVPFFIVQLYCTAGNIPGLTATSYLSDAENLATTIMPTLGSLGSGWLNSPGGSYAASVGVDVMGAKFFEVEFAADPATPATALSSVPGMNALWRPL